MSTVNETIVTGRKFRKCIDAANKVWQRISFWTKACDVECEDGTTVEDKLTQLYSDLGGFSFYPEKLTQAQYDALSEEVKSAPGVIFTIVKE